jgi:ubiquinone/menaquinone biosynthesis C-methylase UbiE
VAVDPLAQRGFTSARAYERGRPGYARDAVRTLVAGLGLNASSRILDLAAGTGQLSRLFAPLVGSVVAVEPSAPMREELARILPDVEVLAGEAERLPLPDGSLDAIVVGEAFHWFARPPAVREIARVLRPRRGLALLWNVPVASDPPWPEELHELVERHRRPAVPQERRYSSGLWRRALELTDVFEPLSRGSTQHAQQLDREAFVAQIASWSYISALDDPTREAVLARVRELAPGRCVVTLRTDFYWTRKR